MTKQSGGIHGENITAQEIEALAHNFDGRNGTRAALRVLKPGGHLVACGGTRTYHRLACAVEDAGFEIRDAILIEREPEYVADIERRMALVMAGPDERARASAKSRLAGKPVGAGPLFTGRLP